MKRYFFLLAAMALLASCTTEVLDKAQGDSDFVSSVTMTATDFEFDADTRTNLDLTASGLSFTWAESDIVGIFPNAGDQVKFPMTAGAGTKSANFDGGGWALRNNYSYAAYYPFSKDNYERSYTALPITYLGQSQSDNSSTAGMGAYDYMVATASMPESGSVAFNFQHIGSVLYLQLTTPDAATFTKLTLSADEAIFTTEATMNISNGTLTPTATSKEMTLDLANISVGANETLYAWMLIAPVDASGKTLTATLTTSESATYTVDLASKNFQTGKAYRLEGTVSVTEAQTTTYYWYIGQTDPSTMTSISPIVSDTSSPGWRLIGTSLPTYSSNNMLWNGATNNITFENRDYYYIALPNNTLKIFNSFGNNETEGYTSNGTIVINGVTYYIYKCNTKARAFGFNIYSAPATPTVITYYYYAGWTLPTIDNVDEIINEEYPAESGSTAMHKAGKKTASPSTMDYTTNSLYNKNEKTNYYVLVPAGHAIYDIIGTNVTNSVFTLYGTITVGNQVHTIYKSNSTSRNIGAIIIRGIVEETTYYWYIGQTDPSTMTSISPIVSDTSSPGWRLIGTSLPTYSSTYMLWYGDANMITFENRDYYYVAVPNQSIQLYNAANGSVMDSFTISTTTIDGIVYYIYSCNTKARAFGYNIF